MSLPADFRFSQASLQDYHDCRRRFELRYLERLPWPAIETEPVLENERYLQKGAAFHHLVHQHQLGLPVGRLSAQIKDEELAEWWQRYLDTVAGTLALESDAAIQKYPEHLLIAPLGDNSLLAKMDLLLVQPGQRLRIVDWKTSRYRPKRTWLASRMQTRIYRFLAVEAATHLNGNQPVDPDQVDMLYWFTYSPAEPEIFAYSQEQYQSDRTQLTGLITEIAGASKFPLTSDEKRCRFCVYRSLCDRGVTAGGLDESEGMLEAGLAADTDLSLEASLNFDQIAEIEF